MLVINYVTPQSTLLDKNICYLSVRGSEDLSRKTSYTPEDTLVVTQQINYTIYSHTQTIHVQGFHSVTANDLSLQDYYTQSPPSLTSSNVMMPDILSACVLYSTYGKYLYEYSIIIYKCKANALKHVFVTNMYIYIYTCMCVRQVPKLYNYTVSLYNLHNPQSMTNWWSDQLCCAICK